MRLSRHPIPTKMHSTFSMNIMILLKVWEADGMIWFSASTCFQLVTRLLLISTMWINKSKTYRASGVLRKNGTKTIRSKLKISNSKILTVKVWKNMLMITYTNLMHWVKNLIFDDGESPLLSKHPLRTLKLCCLLSISWENHSSGLVIGPNSRITLILILKANHSLSTRFLFKRTLLVMLKQLIILAKWLEKNIRLKAPLKKLKSNGKILIFKWRHIRRPGKSKELTLFLLYCKTTWVFCQPKRQAYSTKISKIKLKHGRTICKRFQKRSKCWLKCKDNGFILKLFSHLNKIRIDNLLVISTNSEFSTIE